MSKAKCGVCGGHARKDKPGIIVHEPNCVEGRCLAAHNPGIWPYTARCVKYGESEHGVKHEDKDGNIWPGEWRNFDSGVEETVHSSPFYAQMKHDPIHGSRWFIKNQAGVVIARSPKHYDGPHEAQEALALFMATVNNG